MKNLARLFAAAALMAFSAACVNEIDEISPDSLGFRKVVASFEDGTKTTVDKASGGESKVSWKNKDVIRYFRYEGDPGEVHTVVGNCTHTEISMPELDPSVTEEYIAAIYGAQEGVTYENGVFSLKCGVDEEQDGVFGSGHVSVALAESGATELKFRNVTSMVKFTLSRTDVKYVVFSGNDGEPLHGFGDMEVSFNQNGIPAGLYPGDTGTSIKVTTGNKGDYYISTLPVNLSKGFTLYCCNNAGEVLATAASSKALNIQRNGIYYIGDIGGKYSSIDLSKGVDGTESEIETSNCYIVPQTGRNYMFPARIKGNGQAVGDDVAELEEPDFAYVVWENALSPDRTKAPNIKHGDVVTNVFYRDGYVHFKAVGQGNALIAVMSGNDILWSWHIWIWPGYNIRAYAHTYYGTYVDVEGNTHHRNQVMMDRNLGAVSTESEEQVDYRSWGYLYQWGRKDPFPGRARLVDGAWASTSTWPKDQVSTQETGTVEYSIKNPTTRIYGSTSSRNDWVYANDRPDLWSPDEKTMYDPCPRGWKVPSDLLWVYALNYMGTYTVMVSNHNVNTLNLGGKVSDANPVYYPVTGYFDNKEQKYPQSPNTYAFWWSGKNCNRNAYAFGVFYMADYVQTHSDFTRGMAFNVRCELIGELPRVYVNNITVKPSKVTMEEGTRQQLTAVVEPSGANDRSVKWTSSEPSKVSVDQEGWISALAVTGSSPVTITATAKDGSGVKGTCEVTVVEPTVKALHEANGTANCYLVSASGMYCFDATQKGNGVVPASCSGSESSGITGGKSAAILWQSFNTSSFVSQYETVIEEVSYSNGTIYFTVPKSIRNGNAVIALYDKNLSDSNKTILWSWHIWVVEGYDPTTRTNTQDRDIYYKYSSSKCDVLMDRNLGALSDVKDDPLSIGLMYQWGRKDPFRGLRSFTQESALIQTSAEWPDPVTSTSITGNPDYAARNPMKYILRASANTGDWCTNNLSDLWSRTKTMYDPCPPGWHVPNGGEKGVWATAKWKNGTVPYDTYEVRYGELGSYGMLFDGEMTAKSWYPCGGYITDNSGALLGSKGQKGYYWSADSVTSGNLRKGYCMRIDTFGSYANYYPVMSTARALGASVRCQEEYQQQ